MGATATAPAPFFVATPAQARFCEAVFSGKYRFLAYGGGIRSGKSAVALILVQTLARIFPGSRWAVVRKDLPTVKRNVLPTFSKFRVPGFTGEVNASSWTADCANGSQLIFFTESITEDPDLNRWRGLEVNGFVLEEANELQEVSFRKAIERAGSWVVPGLTVQPPPLVLLTFNPSGGWVKRTFYDPHQAGTLKAPYYFQPATIADNPHIPAEYLESLKSLPETDYKRFVEGDWRFVSGAFFTELAWESHRAPAQHVEGVSPAALRWSGLPAWWTYWGSFDWGFRHPAVFMAFARDGDGTTYLLDTLKMHRLSDEAQAALVKEQMPGPCLTSVYAGHDCFNKRQAHAAAVESVADVFERHGILLSMANTARVQGWAACRRALTVRQADGTTGRPKLVICDTPGNRWAVDRLMELEPDPSNPDDVKKVDATDEGEGGDDAGDCFRYGVATPAWDAVRPPGADRSLVNVADGTDGGLPWESTTVQLGTRAVEMRPRPPGPEGQFGAGWGLD